MSWLSAENPASQHESEAGDAEPVQLEEAAITHSDISPWFLASRTKAKVPVLTTTQTCTFPRLAGVFLTSNWAAATAVRCKMVAFNLLFMAGDCTPFLFSSGQIYFTHHLAPYNTRCSG